MKQGQILFICHIPLASAENELSQVTHATKQALANEVLSDALNKSKVKKHNGELLDLHFIELIESTEII